VHPVLWHRPAEQKPLSAVASELAQMGQLRIGLDSLGEDAQPERVAELDQRPDDRRLARLASIISVSTGS